MATCPKARKFSTVVVINHRTPQVFPDVVPVVRFARDNSYESNDEYDDIPFTDEDYTENVSSMLDLCDDY